MRSRLVALAALAALVGCGARSELEIAPPDAGDDAALSLEACNGVDDDGDGRTDEGVPALRCGEGVCASVSECAGGQQPACVPGPASAEICNGLDDDCDGRTDEDVPEQRCGLAGCETVVRCERGVMPPCVPREPAPESCNLVDDDCDGLTDEQLGFGPRAPAVELREGVGETGDCTSCRWAWDPIMVPDGDELLVIWWLGISGGREMPNVYGRRLDASGAPLGSAELLGPQVLLHMERAGSIPQPPAPLFETVQRLGNRDRPSWGRVEAGELGVDLSPLSSMRCGDATLVWTGERVVQACVDDGSITIGAAAFDGSGAEVRTMGVPGVRASTIAAYEGRVGLVLATFVDDAVGLSFVRLSATGAIVAGPTPIDVPYSNTPRLVATVDGWLYVGQESSSEPHLLYALDIDGQPRPEAPRPFPDGRRLGSASLGDAWASHPTEPLVAFVSQSGDGSPGSPMNVELLNSRGEVVQGWSGPAPADPHTEGDFFTSPDVRFADDGAIQVTWHGLAPNETRNPVYFQEFSCFTP